MSSSDSPLLQVENITKSFGEVSVLRQVSLTIERGDALALVGPSGSGKSTLLHLMGALDVADSGQIVYQSQSLGGMSEDERAQFRNREMGFIFQAHRLLPHCNLLENVLLPVFPQGKVTAEIEERAKSLIDQVGLSHRLDHRPGQLSGGECQRTACVRALINQPGLLLADEPTGALDKQTADELVDLLLSLNRNHGTALVVVTHDPDVAKKMDRIIEMDSLNAPA